MKAASSLSATGVTYKNDSESISGFIADSSSAKLSLLGAG